MKQSATAWSCERYRPSNRQRWAVRLTTAGVLSGVMLNAAVPNGNAAVFTPELTPAAYSPVAKKKTKPTKKAPAKKKNETYQERQERISKSPRSMFAPLAENKGQDTTCVSGEFTTLSVVYDSMAESLAAALPANMRAGVLNQSAAVKQSMASIKVSTLAISEHPFSLGADADDPSYRTPLSQKIVNDLLKIRDGRGSEAIELGNLTLSQAVETSWLYLSVGIMAPLQVGVGLLSTVSFDTTVSTILQVAGYGLTGGSMGLGYLYQGISSAVLNQCVARVTDEQMEDAGKPSDETFDIDMPAFISDTANQLALADSETCPAVADQSLGRIVERTRSYLKSQYPVGSPIRGQIDAAVNSVVRGMKSTQVPHNLIPADKADFTSSESAISTVTPILLGFGPTISERVLQQPELGEALGTIAKIVGGTPLDIVLGLAHNIGQGDDLTETASAYDLTVTKSLTAVYYSYALAVYVFTTVGGSQDFNSLSGSSGLAPGTVPLGPGTFAPFKAIGILANLPLTYGLITYHNVLRTMCFVEDDTTGTGLGAEANKKDPDAHKKAVDEAKAKEAKAKKAQNKKTQSKKSQNKKTQNKKTPTTKTQNPKSSTTTRNSRTAGTTVAPGLQVVPGLTLPEFK